MTRLIFIAVAIFFKSFCFAGDPSTNVIEDGFQSAIKLYQEQKYPEAFEKFKNEYASGKDFAALHYNWGLASYKVNKRGLAAGLWRRALFLDPDFRAASTALDFVSRELPRDNAEMFSSWNALRVKVLDRATLNKFFMSTWLFLALGGFLLVRYFAARRNSLRNELPLPRPPTVAIFMCVAFIVFLSLAALKIYSLSEIHATVADATVSMRTGPNVEDNVIFDVLEGFDVVVDTISNGWVQITLSSGQSGWVKAESLFQHTGKAKLW